MTAILRSAFGSTRLAFLLTGLFCASSDRPLQAERIEIAWPTANRAYFERAPLEAFIQPTESGQVASGLFGCVRTNGTQFHEALDLKPLQRDSRGEATDEVYAVLPGIVRHINRQAGSSSYGRYIVIEHVDQTPAVVTLYAHLREIASGLQVGQPVQRAQMIAIMGRSAGGYTIPKDRAHLHFEIALRLTDQFQSWYDWKKFGSKNDHGLWNGMNLVGLDPLEFYEAFRERRVNNFSEYLSRLSPAVRVHVATKMTPDFIRRYPALRQAAGPAEVNGWEITFNAFGVPFAWSPLAASALEGLKSGQTRVVWTDDALLESCRCKDLTSRERGTTVPGRDLRTTLQLLFGLRS